MKDSDFLLAGQAVDLLHISPRMVRAWADAGKFREYRRPINSYGLSRREDVVAVRLAITRN
jgi:hypothetical protein